MDWCVSRSFLSRKANASNVLPNVCKHHSGSACQKCRRRTLQRRCCESNSLLDKHCRGGRECSYICVRPAQAVIEKFAVENIAKSEYFRHIAVSKINWVSVDEVDIMGRTLWEGLIAS